MIKKEQAISFKKVLEELKKINNRLDVLESDEEPQERKRKKPTTCGFNVYFIVRSDGDISVEHETADDDDSDHEYDYVINGVIAKEDAKQSEIVHAAFKEYETALAYMKGPQ